MFKVYGLYTHIRANRLRSGLLIALLFMMTYIFAFAMYVLFFMEPVPAEGLTLLHMATPHYDYGAAIDAHLFKLVRHGWETFPRYMPVVTALILLWIGIGIGFYRWILAGVAGADFLTRMDNRRLYDMVETLCISGGLPLPRLYVIDTSARNAFAMGLSPEKSAIVVTRGLLEALNDAELDAVLAHELTHIRNGDSMMMVIAIVIVGVFAFAGELIVRLLTGSIISRTDEIHRDPLSEPDIVKENFAQFLVVLAKGRFLTFLRFALSALFVFFVWFFGLMTRFALSRAREYLADAGAVELTKNPDAMISALIKISDYSDVERIPTSMMQMCIDNPRTDFLSIFSTHPSVERRIQVLVDHAGGRMPSERNRTYRSYTTSPFG